MFWFRRSLSHCSVAADVLGPQAAYSAIVRCPIEVGQAILEVNGKSERNEMLEAQEGWRQCMFWGRFVFYVCRAVVMACYGWLESCQTQTARSKQLEKDLGHRRP